MPCDAMSSVNQVFGSESRMIGIEQRQAACGAIELRIRHHLINVGLRNSLLGIIDARGNPFPLGVDDVGNCPVPANQDVGLGLEQPTFAILCAKAEQAPPPATRR